MLGENIIACRKRAGLTQQALAEQLFVTRQTVSKWEKNLSVPDADALVRLAEALEVSVQALLGQPEEQPDTPPDGIAAALSRINDQLARQNRRRSRLWKAVAWILAVFLVINLLLVVLGYVGMAQYTSQETVNTHIQVENIGEAE